MLKVVGERARSPTTFVMITNHFCQLYPFLLYLTGRNFSLNQCNISVILHLSNCGMPKQQPHKIYYNENFYCNLRRVRIVSCSLLP